MRNCGAPAIRRLEQRRDFLRVAKGRKAAMPGLVLQAREGGADGCFRVGFTASRKVGGAVVRNRARRRLKAAVQDVMPGLAREDRDFVLIARLGTASRPYDDLLSDLRHALRRVGGLRDELQADIGAEGAG